ncbi:MAG: tRNA pseudouridine(55) synthase TruB [Hyphomicrobiales bacterium]
MGRRKKGQLIDGWLALDKPRGLTSTQALSRVRRLFDARKAGHGGTLDPLATGMLPIAFGEATKTVSYLMDGLKTYHFTVDWGAQTNTDDTEGEVTATSETRPTRAGIEAILPDFTGEILQTPPQFSAIKIAGERAYDLARSGVEVKIKSRMAQIDTLTLTGEPQIDRATFECTCGKGTYVRSLARDFGLKLGCFGHVTSLRRLAVGPFFEADMISLDKLEEIGHGAAGSAGLVDLLRPVETALDDIPALAVGRDDAARIRSGQPVILRGRDAPIVSGPAYTTHHGIAVALGEVQHGAFSPTRVFNLSA